MLTLSGRQVWDCFKKLMPYQAVNADRYMKEDRNQIKVFMKDGSYAYFTMHEDKFTYEKKL